MGRKKKEIESEEVKQTTNLTIPDVSDVELRVMAGIIVGNALHSVRNIIRNYQWKDNTAKKLYDSVIALDRENMYISTFTVGEKHIQLFGEKADMNMLIGHFGVPGTLVQLANKMVLL